MIVLPFLIVYSFRLFSFNLVWLYAILKHVNGKTDRDILYIRERGMDTERDMESEREKERCR